MKRSPLSAVTYASEIAASSWSHGGEVALATILVVVAGLMALVIRALLRLPPLGAIEYLLFVLVPPMLVVLLGAAALAAWRLNRRQRIALATMRRLLDLNAGDRADFERGLRTRHRLRDTRVEERHAARIARLTGEVADLQSGATDQRELEWEFGVNANSIWPRSRRSARADAHDAPPAAHDQP